MIRVSYSENKWDLSLSEEELEKDNEKNELELEHLGPLYY